MHPKLISIGDFFLPSYGFMVTLGFLLGLWLAGRLARRQGLDADAVTNLAIYCVLGGALGAKLLMLALDFSYYWNNPREIFTLATLQAGGVFYGGLVLALGVAYFYLRRSGLPAWRTADVVAPGVALGHAVGRIGCFLAGCCWGASCRLPWAVTFTDPETHKLFGTPLHQPLHPTQLYESAAEAAVCAILVWRIRRPHRPGTIVGLYLALYSSARLLVEFVRAHQQPNPLEGPLSASQWIALGLLGVGVWAMRRGGTVASGLRRSANSL